MKTYIVNMAKDVVKRRMMADQLAGLSYFDVDFILACEGRMLSEVDLIRFGYNGFNKKYGHIGSLPAFGCSISHRMIYERMLQDNISMAMVLEDDALLSRNLEAVVSEVVNQVILKEPTVILLTPDFFYKTNTEIERLSGGYQIVDVIDGYMTSGYIINKAGAELIYGIQTPISYVADAWSDFKQKGLSIKGIVPHIISFPDGLGEIGQSQLGIPESPIIRARHTMGRIKGNIMSGYRYIIGIRKSTKKW